MTMRYQAGYLFWINKTVIKVTYEIKQVMYG